MSEIGKLMPKEYSDKFDELRQNRVEVSYHKYGSAKINFGDGLVNAVDTAKLCMEAYQKDSNTEHLVDAANYLMFEYMYPQKLGAHFRATGSDESVGTVGEPIGDWGKR